MRFASDMTIHEVATCEDCGEQPRICVEFKTNDIARSVLLCRDCVHLGYLALLAATDDQCHDTQHCQGCTFED